MSLLYKSLSSLHQGICKKDFSPKELWEVFYKQSLFTQPFINSFISISSEIPNNKGQGYLNQIPFALKDNMATKGILTTCASKMLRNFTPSYNATVYETLMANGALLLGKTNMDEFSMGATTQSSFWGPSKNPWDLQRVPGGSSGGSAAAVASLSIPFALGTDTGGSIRQPAAFCGVTGFKPTFGHVSKNGVVAFASSLDQVGPIAKTVKDCALVMDVIGGFDPLDPSTHSYSSYSYTKSLSSSVKGLCIGLPKEFLAACVDADIVKTMEETISTFVKLGVAFKEISIPVFPFLPAVYYIISSVEGASNLARFDGIRFPNPSSLTTKEYRGENFGKEVKRRIMLGTLLSTNLHGENEYKKALAFKEQLKEELDGAFSQCDAILSPVSPTTAPKIGSIQQEATRHHPGDLFTVAANIAGLPALSFPCGFDQKGLPIGLQLMGNKHHDALILTLGHAFEKWQPFPYREVENRWT